MEYKREIYENWIKDYLKPRFPGLVKDFRACLRGYEWIKTNKRIDRTHLNSVIRAASSSRVTLSATATDFLKDLSARYPEVCEAILKMVNDRRWFVRSSALLSVGRETPRDLVITILKMGLRDRSTRVRGLAAWQVQSLHISEMITGLEDQNEIEPNPEVKYTIDMNLRLLRDGYFIQIINGFSPYVWIPTENGIGGATISQNEIDAKGIQSVISELRSKFNS
jgi:hypothetical protein